MIVDAFKINSEIYNKYYYVKGEYDIQNDVEMTYQELSLVLTCHNACLANEGSVDTDDLIDCADFYEDEFLSQFNNPVTKLFSWDEIIERLYRERKPNIRKDKNGNKIGWKIWEEYRELWIETKKKRTELEEAFLKEDTIRKAKAKEYQRQRREKIKSLESMSTPKGINNQLGERLKKRRKELNMTLKELSSKTMLKPQLISDYENGRKEPGIRNFMTLCNGLQANPNYFLLDDVQDEERRDTYGYLFKTLFNYVDNSPNDTLIIDDEKKEVYLKIEDPNMVGALLNLKMFLPNEDFASCIKTMLGSFVLASEKIQKKNK